MKELYNSLRTNNVTDQDQLASFDPGGSRTLKL